MLGKHAHVQAPQAIRMVGIKNLPLLGCQILHAPGNERLGLRMQYQGLPQRSGSTLAGVVIGRGPDASERKHHIGRLERLL